MSKVERHPIELVIFDLGGTIIDHGCMAPVEAFVNAFGEVGIEITTEEARRPMGLAKLDHIREIFKLPSITAQWASRWDRDWSEEDVVASYQRFLPLQTELATRHNDIIPGLTECWTWLRDAGISIGATTGYPRRIAGPILATLSQAGFRLDADVCTDEVPVGRPEPWMIQRIMEQLHVATPRAVVNVGDTVPDMQSARNARVGAVGITESGSEFGLTVGQLAAMNTADRAARHEAAARKLRAAGAQAIIKSLAELPAAIGELLLPEHE